MNVPDFIIHYSRGEPFRSLSGVSQDKLTETLKGLNETNAWGLTRFSDPEYLNRRALVERKIRDGFTAKGGNPVLDNPIYFFLGRNARFEERKENTGYRILLKDLPEDAVSFTYGDSMISFNEDYRQLKGASYLSDLCTRVYKLHDLPNMFSHPDYLSPLGLHIEAQLWIMPSGAQFTEGQS